MIKLLSARNDGWARQKTHFSHIFKLFSTHEVFNQGVPLADFNLYKSDPILESFAKSFADSSGPNLLDQYGAYCGTQEKMKDAKHAQLNSPTLVQFDNYGRRIDVVSYHQSYHDLMSAGLTAGVSGYGFATPIQGSHVTRAGLLYMQNQLEPGHCCPLVMTTAAIIPLQKNGQNDLVTKLSNLKYDPRNIPVDEKEAITAGMSMTEKQGGSDVRANTTKACPIDLNWTGNGQAYRLTGHKWYNL